MAQYSDIEPVRVLSRAMVRPSQPTSRHSFFLPCLDIFWQDIHYNQRLLFYKSSGNDGCSVAAVMNKLKSSLALCLVHYYPWCGRIAKAPLPPHRVFIDCNDAGVEFVEASSDLPLSHLTQAGCQMKPFFLHLSQCPDHTGGSLYRSPLLSIQATVFSDGGLVVGIAQSHVVADGQALWNFMVSWGECARGVPLSVPPLHNRERLAVPHPSTERGAWLEAQLSKMVNVEVEEDVECGVPEKKDKDNGRVSVETDASSGDKLISPRMGTSSGQESCNGSSNRDAGAGEQASGTRVGEPDGDPLVQCVLNLSSSAVMQLKREAGGAFTSYEVTCAHFWQRMTIARQIARGDPVHFVVFVNCRTRVTPPLPPAYFGNVISFYAAQSTAGRIESESLGTTASRVHKAIAAVDQEFVEGFMHWLEINDNRAKIDHSTAPKGKGINVASSPRFPAYQVDFGWGTPAAVRPVKAGGEGELILFGGCPGSMPGDVEICTALPAPVLRLLLEDPAFLAKAPCTPFANNE